MKSKYFEKCLCIFSRKKCSLMKILLLKSLSRESCVIIVGEILKITGSKPNLSVCWSIEIISIQNFLALIILHLRFTRIQHKFVMESLYHRKHTDFYTNTWYKHIICFIHGNKSMGCFIHGYKFMGCLIHGYKPIVCFIKEYKSMVCFIHGYQSMGCFIQGSKSIWGFYTGIQVYGYF